MKGEDTGWDGISQRPQGASSAQDTGWRRRVGGICGWSGNAGKNRKWVWPVWENCVRQRTGEALPAQT